MPAWPAPSHSFPSHAFASQAGPHGGLGGFADPWMGPASTQTWICKIPVFSGKINNRFPFVFLKSEIWDARLALLVLRFKVRFVSSPVPPLVLPQQCLASWQSYFSSCFSITHQSTGAWGGMFQNYLVLVWAAPAPVWGVLPQDAQPEAG